MTDKLRRIQTIGFTRAGCWKLSGNALAYELNELATAQNVLYAFVVDGELLYVGKTIKSLHHRMQRYKTPAKTAEKGGSTNIRTSRTISKSAKS